MKRFFLLVSFVVAMQSVNAQKVFSVNYQNQADIKVFVVDYTNQADLKIFFVNYSNQAGWVNHSKKQLLY